MISLAHSLDVKDSCLDLFVDRPLLVDDDSGRCGAWAYCRRRVVVVHSLKLQRGTPSTKDTKVVYIC
jgi:hypothetical protein